MPNDRKGDKKRRVHERERERERGLALKCNNQSNNYLIITILGEFDLLINRLHNNITK